VKSSKVLPYDLSPLHALETAMQVEKKKLEVIVGPQDAVGILFFNTIVLSPFGLCSPSASLILLLME
jgi:hypothetical protein